MAVHAGFMTLYCCSSSLLSWFSYELWCLVRNCIIISFNFMPLQSQVLLFQRLWSVVVCWIFSLLITFQSFMSCDCDPVVSQNGCWDGYIYCAVLHDVPIVGQPMGLYCSDVVLKYILIRWCKYPWWKTLSLYVLIFKFNQRSLT